MIDLKQPEKNTTDVLTELLRQGAKDLICQAVSAELQTLLECHRDKKINGRQAMVPWALGRLYRVQPYLPWYLNWVKVLRNTGGSCEDSSYWPM